MQDGAGAVRRARQKCSVTCNPLFHVLAAAVSPGAAPAHNHQHRAADTRAVTRAPLQCATLATPKQSLCWVCVWLRSETQAEAEGAA